MIFNHLLIELQRLLTNYGKSSCNIVKSITNTPLASIEVAKHVLEAPEDVAHAEKEYCKVASYDITTVNM